MKILLLQFKTDPLCAQRREALTDAGAIVTEAEPRWPVFFDALNAHRPDAIVIAASTIPSHGMEAARYLGEGFNTRDIPVFFVDVAPKDRARAQTSAPRATLTESSALPQIVKQPSTS